MLRFISKLSVNFSPLQDSSRSLRAFVGRVCVDKHRRDNPKCDIAINVSDKVEKPWLEVVYVDKTVLKLNTETLLVEEIVKDVNRHSKRLQIKDDIATAS